MVGRDGHIDTALTSKSRLLKRSAGLNDREFEHNYRVDVMDPAEVSFLVSFMLVLTTVRSNCR
jgi:hypothetical protein